MTKNTVYQKRIKKDLDFRTNKNSPIPRLLRKKFKGLLYFDYNPNFILSAKFKRFENREPINISTNYGNKENYSIFGELSFNMQEKEHTLLVFQKEANSDYLWLPFRDKTNGITTYNAGRYMDFSVQELSDIVELDFNLAYNPYCAYNSNYACPVIPSENHLDVEILAGELIYR